MLQRLEEVKQNLQQTVVCDDWNDWLADYNSAFNDEADEIRTTVSSGRKGPRRCSLRQEARSVMLLCFHASPNKERQPTSS
jgi:hypothetical protein